MDTKVCTFCKNKGINPPHNHTLRNWTLKNKPIICPQLLSTQCTFCKIKGHTKQYCPIRLNMNKYLIKNDIENNLKRTFEKIDISSNKKQKK